MGRIKNGLEKALNWGKAVVISLPLIVGAYGCEKPEPDPIVNPPKNDPPEVTLNIEPNYGKSPLISSIEVSGTDKQGLEDIKKYKLGINSKTVEKTVPFDTLVTLRNSGDIEKTYEISGEVIDSKGQSSKTSKSVTVLPEDLIILRRPNDSTYNWHGSSDANKNNIPFEQADANMIRDYLSGTYFPVDSRFINRGDVTGDGKLSMDDAEIIEKRAKGEIDYIKGSEWEKSTIPEQLEWFTKTFELSKIKESGFPPGSCGLYSYKTTLYFYGYNDKSLSNILAFYPFDESYNGLYNLPVLNLMVAAYNTEGEITQGHGMNRIYLGKKLDLENRFDLEPQNGIIGKIENIYPGFVENSKIQIRGPIITHGSPGQIASTTYLTYEGKEGIEKLIYQNPRLETSIEK
ncbi:MAG: hypothetical protein JXB49_24035 [Bacteroidales bacterium]|nr:hypothetical protein [Bacteroidales bacterium]